MYHSLTSDKTFSGSEILEKRPSEPSSEQGCGKVRLLRVDSLWSEVRGVRYEVVPRLPIELYQIYKGPWLAFLK